ncbi:MAG: hypothetical protein ACFCD0_06665 [Gemmataceae bacterium]
MEYVAFQETPYPPEEAGKDFCLGFGEHSADASCAGCDKAISKESRHLEQDSGRATLSVRFSARYLEKLCHHKGKQDVGETHGTEAIADPAYAFWGQSVKGVAMKRFALLLSATLAILISAQSAHAWGSLGYGGYQPWWNIFAKRNPGMTVEEQRLQRFWHDYYDAMKRYYGMLDNIDWVSYYKNHGYQINSGCGYGGGPCGGPQRIQFAPVFVSPTMNWAVPNSSLIGPPSAPMGPPPGMFGGGYQHHAGYTPNPYGGYNPYGGHQHQSGYQGGYPSQGQYPYPH